MRCAAATNEADALLCAVNAAEAADPDILWVRLFTLAAYVMTANCAYRAIRSGAETIRTPKWIGESGTKRALRAAAPVLGLAFFAFFYWALESWAHHRTPFYLFSTQFSDLVPRIPFEAWGIDRAAGATNACAVLVIELSKEMNSDRIPLSVILMEASLTYAAMWTARLLGTNIVIQPLLAALVLVIVDAFLDPVAATSHGCPGNQIERAGLGLGLWRWYLDPQVAASWFSVPVFNYAAWFGAPILLVSLDNLKHWVFGRIWKLPERPPDAPKDWLWLLMGGIAAVVVLAVILTPAVLSPLYQQLILGTAILVSAIFVYRGIDKGRVYETVDPGLVRPVALALTLPALALLWEGFFTEIPLLIPVGVCAVSLGVLLVSLPYGDDLDRFCRRVDFVDRFVRYHFFGFTAMLVLLGAASVSSDPEPSRVGLLIMVAIFFHAYSYVSNDVIDLPIDRLQERRQQDPLVSGRVSRESAIAFCCVAVLLLGLSVFLIQSETVELSQAGGPEPIRGTPLVILAGLALITIYNVYGKRCPVPPLTDLVQALGWGSLVAYGALTANPGASLEELFRRAGPMFAYGAGFIFMINGVHGGLRDLRNDQQFGLKTTAIFFGARPIEGAENSAVRSTVGVAVFAFVVHSLMFVFIFQFLFSPPTPLTSDRPVFDEGAFGWAVGLILTFFALSNYMLYRVVKPIEPKRDAWMSAHVFVVLLPPLILYLVSGVPDNVFKVTVLSAFIFPLLFQEAYVKKLIAFFRKEIPLTDLGNPLDQDS